MPLPSGSDIANTLKYFSQTLLSKYNNPHIHTKRERISLWKLRPLVECFTYIFIAVLKDVRNSPLEMIKDPEMDQTRMSSYPNLEYSNLYNAICMLVSKFKYFIESLKLRAFFTLD